MKTVVKILIRTELDSIDDIIIVLDQLTANVDEYLDIVKEENSFNKLNIETIAVNTSKTKDLSISSSSTSAIDFFIVRSS